MLFRSNQARYQLRNTSARIPLYPLRPQTSRLCSVPLHILGVLGCETGLRRRLNPAIMKSIHRAGKTGAANGAAPLRKAGRHAGPGPETPKKTACRSLFRHAVPEKKKRERGVDEKVCLLSSGRRTRVPVPGAFLLGTSIQYRKDVTKS